MTSESLYARAYARALLGVAQNKHAIEHVMQDVQALMLQWQGSPELRQFCHSRTRCLPGTPTDIIQSIWGNSICTTTRDFLAKLYELRQLRSLPIILARFLELENRAAGRHEVNVAFACEPNQSELERLHRMITAAYGPFFNMQVQIDRSLLAGFRLVIDDRLVDASLAGRLSRLKQGLMKPQQPGAVANGE